MSGKARRAASASEQNVRNLMSRREFLRRVGGAAGAAALPTLPAIAAVPSQIPADPFAEALAQLARMKIPPALERGFRLPGGAEILASGGDAHMWGPEDLFGMTKEEMQQTKAAMEAARAALPSAPKEGISYFNHLTGQWHRQANVQTKPHSWEFSYLRSGEEVPSAIVEASKDFEPWLPEDISSFRFTDGTLTKPGMPFKRAISQSGYPSQTGEVGPARTQIENLTRDWREAQTQLLEAAKNDPTPEGRKRYQEQLDTLGLAPGGRYSMPPALQDTGTPTGLMSLLDDPSAPADDIQPNKLWQGRYPKGMYRAAAGSALAGLLAPIVMQESQDGR